MKAKIKHAVEGKERKDRLWVKKNTITAYNTLGVGEISNFHL